MTPKIKPVHQSLYPTHNSFDQVIAAALSAVPVTGTNDMYALLMQYHNTLLQELHDERVNNARTN